jgi:hypothetical protein
MPWDGRLGKLQAAPEVLVVRADPAAGGLLWQDEAHNAQQFHGNVDVAMVPGLSHACTSRILPAWPPSSTHSSNA